MLIFVNPVTDHHEGHDDHNGDHEHGDHDHSDHHPDPITNFGVLAFGSSISKTEMYNENGEILNIDLTAGAGVNNVSGACSVAHNNKMWVFGGQEGSAKRQVLEVSDCEVQKVGELDFDLYLGSCAVAHDEFYLCFNYKVDSDVCRRGSDPLGSFSQISKTAHSHSLASMASSGSKLFNFIPNM